MNRLGVFSAGELAFVRELLQGEGIAYREAPQLRGGAIELCVEATEHARALALLVEAQADAEAAAYRESAAVPAEREPARSAASATLRAQRPRSTAPSADRAATVAVGLIGGFILTCVLIVVIGERYGSQSPMLRHGRPMVCSTTRFATTCREP
jgi:hypothetical protein